MLIFYQHCEAWIYKVLLYYKTIDVLKADVLHIIIGPNFILDLLSEGEFINILLLI